MFSSSLISKNLLATAALVSLTIYGRPALASDNTTQESTTVEKTTINGDPTIIQHIDSKMEPTVVQSRTSTDPQTGDKEKIVEPIIMERHDKVLDTTIIQPQVNETRTTTEQVQHKSELVPAPAVKKTETHSVVVKPHKPRYIAHHVRRVHKVAYHRAAAPRAVASSVNRVVQTTEVTRQPVVKETYIQGGPDNGPPVPQVIHKVEQKVEKPAE